MLNNYHTAHCISFNCSMCKIIFLNHSFTGANFQSSFNNQNNCLESLSYLACKGLKNFKVKYTKISHTIPEAKVGTTFKHIHIN